jgi:hypothetical protein
MGAGVVVEAPDFTTCSREANGVVDIAVPGGVNLVN